jgi:phosphoribosylformylglycinamidine cyclo-ligase
VRRPKPPGGQKPSPLIFRMTRWYCGLRGTHGRCPSRVGRQAAAMIVSRIGFGQPRPPRDGGGERRDFGYCVCEAETKTRADRRRTSDAGVNLEAADERSSTAIGPAVRRTYGPRVLPSHGAFAGLFRLDYDERLFARNYRDPVLVACTDGVGSKLLIAIRRSRYDTIGIDLVAMNVNDLLCCGAEPLLLPRLRRGHQAAKPDVVTALDRAASRPAARRRAAPCSVARRRRCPTSTASGTSTWRASPSAWSSATADRCRPKGPPGRPADRPAVVAGCTPTATPWPASCCCDNAGLRLREAGSHARASRWSMPCCGRRGSTSGPVLDVLRQYRKRPMMTGMAHITGGGLPGNVPRMLPDDCDAVFAAGLADPADLWAARAPRRRRRRDVPRLQHGDRFRAGGAAEVRSARSCGG